MRTRKIAPSEHQMQVAVVDWCRWNAGKYKCLDIVYATPNAAPRATFTGYRMVKEGMLKGVPDLCLPKQSGGYGALYIEMKTPKGKITGDQIKTMNRLREEGNLAVVCFSVQDAIETILTYLNLDNHENKVRS